jgi:hypothetical protein
LSRDPDFIAGSFRVVLGNCADSFPETTRTLAFTQSWSLQVSRERSGQSRNMSTRDPEHDDRELNRESERYRRAAVEALGQLEWCIEYLHGQRRTEIARALSRNRSRIIERARL